MGRPGGSPTAPPRPRSQTHSPRPCAVTGEPKPAGGQPPRRPPATAHSLEGTVRSWQRRLAQTPAHPRRPQLRPAADARGSKSSPTPPRRTRDLAEGCGFPNPANRRPPCLPSHLRLRDGRGGSLREGRRCVVPRPDLRPCPQDSSARGDTRFRRRQHREDGDLHVQQRLLAVPGSPGPAGSLMWAEPAHSGFFCVLTLRVQEALGYHVGSRRGIPLPCNSGRRDLGPAGSFSYLPPPPPSPPSGLWAGCVGPTRCHRSQRSCLSTPCPRREGRSHCARDPGAHRPPPSPDLL